MLCQKLGETNFKLIKKLIEPIDGASRVTLYSKVIDIQKQGGLANEQIGGFKQPGGVFIKLCKEHAPESINLR